MVHLSKNKNKKVLVVIIAVVILSLGVVTFMVVFNKTNSAAPTAKNLPTAQSNFNSGTVKRQPANTPDSVASATDNNGSATMTTPPSSQWTTSKDGSSIVIYSPSPNTVVSSGDTVYGTAKTTTVSYELEDNVSGVTTQGVANVVNGKFSIKFTFTTKATSGKINIFNQDAEGVIKNIVTVPVSFK